MKLTVVAVGLIALIADLMLRFTWYGAGARSSNRGRGGGAVALVLLVVALLFIILAPIAATVMKLAISRRREDLADAPRIGELITGERLPAYGLDEYRETFFVLEDGERVVGCAGLEVYGEAAL